MEKKIFYLLEEEEEEIHETYIPNELNNEPEEDIAIQKRKLGKPQKYDVIIGDIIKFLIN